MPELDVNMFLVFGVFAIWPMYLLIKAEYHRYKNNHAPEIRVAAEVTKKSLTSDNIQYTSWAMRDGGTVYYATFLTEDGQTLELSMGDIKYGGLRVGDKGALRYQGNKMLEFTKDK